MKAYNAYMKEEIRRLRRERPELAGKEHQQTVFRTAARSWHDAPANPKNAPAEDGAAAGGSGGGSGSGGTAEEQDVPGEVPMGEAADDVDIMDTGGGGADAPSARPQRGRTRGSGKAVAERI